MLEFIFEGGFMMYPIVFMSVLGFAIMIDRFCAFRAASRDNDALRQNVMQAVAEQHIDAAIDECKRVGGPIAAVLLVGLSKFEKLLQQEDRTMNEISDLVKKSMEDYAPRAVAVLDNHIASLPIVASLSPLLGMTGTVTGMIGSFNAMAESTALEATTVSAGISEALVTTAAGLIVAMPSVIAYNIFSKKVDTYVQDIESAVTELSDYIALDYGR